MIFDTSLVPVNKAPDTFETNSAIGLNSFAWNKENSKCDRIDVSLTCGVKSIHVSLMTDSTFKSESFDENVSSTNVPKCQTSSQSTQNVANPVTHTCVSKSNCSEAMSQTVIKHSGLQGDNDENMCNQYQEMSDNLKKDSDLNGNCMKTSSDSGFCDDKNSQKIQQVKHDEESLYVHGSNECIHTDGCSSKAEQYSLVYPSTTGNPDSIAKDKHISTKISVNDEAEGGLEHNLENERPDISYEDDIGEKLSSRDKSTSLVHCDGSCSTGGDENGKISTESSVGYKSNFKHLKCDASNELKTSSVSEDLPLTCNNLEVGTSSCLNPAPTQEQTHEFCASNQSQVSESLTGHRDEVSRKVANNKTSENETEIISNVNLSTEQLVTDEVKSPSNYLQNHTLSTALDLSSENIKPMQNLESIHVELETPPHHTSVDPHSHVEDSAIKSQPMTYVSVFDGASVNPCNILKRPKGANIDQKNPQDGALVNDNDFSRNQKSSTTSYIGSGYPKNYTSVFESSALDKNNMGRGSTKKYVSVFDPPEISNKSKKSNFHSNMFDNSNSIFNSSNLYNDSSYLRTAYNVGLDDIPEVEPTTPTGSPPTYDDMINNDQDYKALVSSYCEPDDMSDTKANLPKRSMSEPGIFLARFSSQEEIRKFKYNFCLTPGLMEDSSEEEDLVHNSDLTSNDYECHLKRTANIALSGSYSSDDNVSVMKPKSDEKIEAVKSPTLSTAGKGDETNTEVTLSNVFEDKAENFVMAALFCASEEGNLTGLKELINMANSIDLNVSNKHGESAVHMAASGGHVDILKFLKTKEVDLSVLDKNGDSALYWASRQGNTEVVKFLCEDGLNVDTRNKSGEAAVHVASRYGHASVVEYLCTAEADVNLQDNLGETALHSAAWHGYVSIVQSLCSADANTDLQNKEGETALHCAAARGYQECVRVLLDNGCSLNFTDKRGCTALHLSCNRRLTSIALLLLQAGCDVDFTDKETGDSALHSAAREGLLSVVQAMCSSGCDVDITNQDNITPLHLAARGGHTEIVRSLLLSGANPDVKNRDGVAAEIMALGYGYPHIAELLRKARGERGLTYITQLSESKEFLSRIKLKVLGSAGVGKTTLIETLKTGYFGSFFRRTRLNSNTSNSSFKGKKPLCRQYSLPTPLCYTVTNQSYTKGINVQQVTLSGVGELSTWDFSGYEPYYQLYDHFLGDVNCIHCVLFSLMSPFDEQLAQTMFWLNFLISRVPPQLPIQHGGRPSNIAKVILIATHADKAGLVRGAKGEYSSAEATAILKKAIHEFQNDLDIFDHVFVMDSQVALSHEIKTLKIHMAQLKTQIIQNLPPSSGFLDAMILQLQAWRRASSSFPVLNWPEFINYVRTKVNPLASDEHIKLLSEQLQFLGEIIYLEGETNDMVILHPKWLCSDIIGNLISHEKIIQSRITGCFSIDDFQLMYPESDAHDLLQVLEALELCTQCENDGDIEYEFPCLNFIETLDGLWQKDVKRYPDAVYGGVRMKSDCECEYGNQLKCLFPRIQVCLRRNILQETDNADIDLYQWHHGSKYCCGDLEGMITMDRNEQYIELKVRGPKRQRTSMFYFLEDFVNIVEQVMQNICPGLLIERHSLSCLQLRSHSKTVRGYSPFEILNCQVEKKTSIHLDKNQTEELADLLFFNSDEVINNVCLGVDLHVSNLSLHARKLLARVLDPSDPMGRDWCLLALKLGLEQDLPFLDSESLFKESRTDKVLLDWSKKSNSSIELLIKTLREINREDGAEVMLRAGPLFKVLIDEEQSTDESAMVPTEASTNTLSNLSR